MRQVKGLNPLEARISDRQPEHSLPCHPEQGRGVWHRTGGTFLSRPDVSIRRPARRTRHDRHGAAPIRRGFTLIELLVVISVIVLLMALLLPALQKARRQSKTAFCQMNLHQWGIAFSAYTNDYAGRLPNHFPTGAGNHVWPYALRSYFSDTNDALLCPEAPTPWLRPDNRYPTTGFTQKILGSTAAAWEYRFELGKMPKVHFIGSYGINRYADHALLGRRSIGPVWNSVPVLLDCIFMDGHGWPFSSPPEFEDDISGPGDIKYFCINRHDAGINGLFLDWSARKVGLKELWTLRWDAHYSASMINHSPWTIAGGVQPEDWPKWMRRFKDY